MGDFLPELHRELMRKRWDRIEIAIGTAVIIVFVLILLAVGLPLVRAVLWWF